MAAPVGHPCFSRVARVAHLAPSSSRDRRAPADRILGWLVRIHAALHSNAPARTNTPKAVQPQRLTKRLSRPLRRPPYSPIRAFSLILCIACRQRLQIRAVSDRFSGPRYSYLAVPRTPFRHPLGNCSLARTSNPQLTHLPSVSTPATTQQPLSNDGKSYLWGVARTP